MYNVEPYVEQCIKSLYDQDIPFNEFEVIVIDDCSSDNSVHIVKSLQKEFPTLHLFIQPENRRQGAARNMGIRHARGNYIWFVDSDDYLKANVLQTLLNEAEKNNVDILHFNFETRDWNDEIIPVPNYELDVCSGAEFVFDGHERWNHKIGEVCRWIILKNYITDHKFYFEENVQFEDTDYAIKLLAYANRVKHLNLSPYCYRKVLTSVTNSEVSITKLKYKVLMAIRFAYLIDLFLRENRDQRFIAALKEFITYEVKIAYKEVCRFNRQRKRQFKSMLCELNIAKLKNHLSPYKYYLLKQPFFWITSIDFWKVGDSWKSLKSFVKARSLALVFSITYI
jgi:glycosyltransferase involved in cell wall biosynthesis